MGRLFYLRSRANLFAACGANKKVQNAVQRLLVAAAPNGINGVNPQMQSAEQIKKRRTQFSGFWLQPLPNKINSIIFSALEASKYKNILNKSLKSLFLYFKLYNLNFS